MAALDFPASPTMDQVYNGTNGAAYQWDGTVWKVATDTGSPIVIAPAPPASPVVGQLWWRNDPDGSMFVYYDDGNSKQFVPAVSYTGGPVGPAGGSLSGQYPDPTIPALSVQARVRGNATQSIPNATTTVIVFDTVQTNVGGVYSAAAPNRFTIQQAGFYMVGGMVQWGEGGVPPVGNYRMVALQANGNTPLAQSQGRPGYYSIISIVTACAFVAGDYVQLTANQDSGAAVPTGGSWTTNMWIARIA